MEILKTMLSITAYQHYENINIRKFKQDFPADLTSSSSFELFYKMNAGYFYILSYGVVVFFEVREEQKKKLLKQLEPYSEHILSVPYKEEFLVEVKAGTGPVFSYSSLQVPELNEDIIRIIMLQVAQSAALNFYKEQSNDLLQNTMLFTHSLEKKGRLITPRKKLLKFIGKALNTRNRIIDDLYVMDLPPVAWDNELLGKVNDGLEKTFDIQGRFREVEFMLKTVRENLGVLVELIDTRASHLLEWIIIILILIEVVHMVVTQLL